MICHLKRQGMEVGVWDGNTGLTISLTQFLLTKPLTYLLNFLLSKWYIEFLPKWVQQDIKIWEEQIQKVKTYSKQSTRVNMQDTSIRAGVVHILLYYKYESKEVVFRSCHIWKESQQELIDVDASLQMNYELHKSQYQMKDLKIKKGNFTAAKV